MIFQIPAKTLLPLSDRFFRGGPGPMVGRHILNTGCGAFYADRLENPTTVLSRAGGNLALEGEPEALSPQDLRDTIGVGMLEARPHFEAVLRDAFPNMLIWPRLVYILDREPGIKKPGGFFFRRLNAGDATPLQEMSHENHWIWNTWKTAESLATSGTAWAAFDGDKLVALASAFFVGDAFEDIGVATEAEYRGRGLSSACTGLLCMDIQGRGKIPSWTTSKANIASQRVAEKNGFRLSREDFLFVINTDIPD